MTSPENQAYWAIYAREYFNLVDHRIPKLFEEQRNGGDFSKEFNDYTLALIQKAYDRLAWLENVYPALKTVKL